MRKRVALLRRRRRRPWWAQPGWRERRHAAMRCASPPGRVSFSLPRAVNPPLQLCSGRRRLLQRCGLPTDASTRTPSPLPPLRRLRPCVLCTWATCLRTPRCVTWTSGRPLASAWRPHGCPPLPSGSQPTLAGALPGAARRHGPSAARCMLCAPAAAVRAASRCQLPARCPCVCGKTAGRAQRASPIAPAKPNRRSLAAQACAGTGPKCCQAGASSGCGWWATGRCWPPAR